MVEKAPGRRERKKRQTSEAIQVAARRLFAAQGYVSTTVQQIADEADVSERTLFRYFESKEDLLLPDVVAFSAMRSTVHAEARPDPDALATAREELQRKLAAGEVSIGAFSREWRALERPAPAVTAAPDEERLQKGRKLLTGFGTLWRDLAVPDNLREEAVREIFTRFEVDGPDLVAAYPVPNENAWLLGQAALRDGSLQLQEYVGLVGARGVAPPILVGS